jgi:hypothetical protein
MYTNSVVFQTTGNDFELKYQNVGMWGKGPTSLVQGNLVSSTDGINWVLYTPTAAPTFTKGTVYGIVFGNRPDPEDVAGGYFFVVQRGAYISDDQFATNVTVIANRQFAYLAMNATQVYKNYTPFDPTAVSFSARLMASF